LAGLENALYVEALTEDYFRVAIQQSDRTSQYKRVLRYLWALEPFG